MIYIVVGIFIFIVVGIIVFKKNLSKEPYSYELLEQEETLTPKEEKELLEKSIALYRTKKDSLDA